MDVRESLREVGAAAAALLVLVAAWGTSHGLHAAGIGAGPPRFAAPDADGTDPEAWSPGDGGVARTVVLLSPSAGAPGPLRRLGEVELELRGERRTDVVSLADELRQLVAGERPDLVLVGLAPADLSDAALGSAEVGAFVTAHATTRILGECAARCADVGARLVVWTDGRGAPPWRPSATAPPVDAGARLRTALLAASVEHDFRLAPPLDPRGALEEGPAEKLEEALARALADGGSR